MDDATEFDDRVLATLYGTAIGVGSDKTPQLCLAVGASLVRSGGFRREDVVRAHIEALFGTTDRTELHRRLAIYDECDGKRVDARRSGSNSWMGAGLRWDEASEKATAEFARFRVTDGRHGRHPESGVTAQHEAVDDPEIDAAIESGGRGRKPAKKKRVINGAIGTDPAMKVPPLAIVYRAAKHIPDPPFVMDRSSVLALASWPMARQTHLDARAAHAALAVGVAIGVMLALPKDMGASRVRELLFRQVITAVKTSELNDRRIGSYGTDVKEAELISTRLQLAHANLRTAEALRGAVGIGPTSLEAIPLAIGTALRNVDDFENGIVESAGHGGDTGAVGSMVGAILGARVGVAGIPRRFVAGLRKGVRFDIQDLAPKLARLSLKIRPLD